SAGILKASETGIFIRDSVVFEKIRKVKSVIFDKTGTLTRGELTVKAIHTLSNTEEKELVRIAYSLARLSAHPLTSAIVKYAEANGYDFLNVSELKSVSGKGITGKIDGKRYFLGSYSFVKENSNDSGTFIEDEVTSVWLADENVILGYINLDDLTDNAARELATLLKRDGYRIVVMSGDKDEPVKKLAEYIGAEAYYSQMTPEMKAEIINKIKNSENMVIFAGDGTNDIPALMASDIGVALAKGTDIAIESGDVVILRDNIRLIHSFIEIARKVSNRIRMNLLWATLYNIILIPFALGLSYILWGVVFRPEFSAFAMMLSSLSVTLISLSIRFYQPSVLKDSTT
ncbi:MAG: HAD-IC family P-type ATPase, partial [Deltaproteobacteria bacterium]|nr:HAD-IC family P-type ATPase [Deltaproteobacteria bacterium]